MPFPVSRGRSRSTEARLGAVGDHCIVIAYRQEEVFTGADVVFVDPVDNRLKETMRYEAAQPSEL